MLKLDILRTIKERGFLSKDVAAKLGISKVSMSRRVNSDNPHLDTLTTIAGIIGCEVTDFFYRVDKDGNVTGKSAQAKDVFPGEENEKMTDRGINGKSADDTQPDIFAPSCGKGDRGAGGGESDNANCRNEKCAQNPSGQRVLFCPHCGTKFIVLDSPKG